MISPGDEPIPGYRVEELLGRGQFGQVWRARSPGGTLVALKFLDLGGRQGWKEFRAIQRVKQIRHAHLMPVVAIWLLDEQGKVIDDDAIDTIANHHHQTQHDSESEETLVAQSNKQTRRPAQLIVANLVADNTLGDRLRECRQEGRKGIPVDELLRYMVEAAKGLDFLNSPRHAVANALGAVQHCDVKPDNIMLLGGSVVISDFGVAQIHGESRTNVTATSHAGTPAYMAPECFLSKTSQTTDQYGLAITYYELRTGRLPFHEESYVAVCEAHKDGTLDFSAASIAERKVLKKATSIDPKQRYASCAEFVERLQQAVRPTPKKAVVPAWPMVTATVLVLLAGVAGALLFPWNRDDGKGKTVPTDGVKAGELARTDERDSRASVPTDGFKAGELAPTDERDSRALAPADGVKADKPPLEPSASELADEARKLLEDGKFDDAVAAMRRALKKDPELFAKVLKDFPIVRHVNGGEVTCLEADPTGEGVVAALADGHVVRWSIPSDSRDVKEQVISTNHSPSGIKQLAIFGNKVAWVLSDGSRILLTGLGQPDLELTVPEPADRITQITQLAFAGQGRWLVATSELLDLSDTAEPPVVALHAWNLAAGDIPQSRQELLQDGEMEPKLAAARTEPWVVVSSYRSPGGPGIVRQCWMETRENKVLSEQFAEVNRLAVSDDDRRIAIAGKLVDAAYHVLLLDSQSSRSQLLPPEWDDLLSNLSFGPHGESLATGEYEIGLWTLPNNWNGSQEITSQPMPMPPPDHPDHSASSTAQSLVCLDDAKGVIAQYVHGVYWIGPRATGKKPKPLWHGAGKLRATTLAATPDLHWLITGHRDGSVRFWPLRHVELVLRASDEEGIEIPPASDDPSV
jgi:serine/threonine protein kinase